MSKKKKKKRKSKNKFRKLDKVLNKSDITGKDKNGATIRGNPETFYGPGLVAFIDLLGFTSEVLNNWGEHQHSALCKLLRIKSSGVVSNDKLRHAFGSYSLTEDSQPVHHNIYRCKVFTLSDSIVLCLALSQNFDAEALLLGFLSIYISLLDIWITTIIEGFTIRGAITIGDIFWNSAEIIGPALIQAYELEKQEGKWSRVILSSELIRTILLPLNDPIRTRSFYDFEQIILPSLIKCKDGRIAVNPSLLAKRGEEFPINPVVKLKSLRSSCNNIEKKQKYDELIFSLEYPGAIKKPAPYDLKLSISEATLG